MSDSCSRQFPPRPFALLLASFFALPLSTLLPSLTGGEKGGLFGAVSSLFGGKKPADEEASSPQQGGRGGGGHASRGVDHAGVWFPENQGDSGQLMAEVKRLEQELAEAKKLEPEVRQLKQIGEEAKRVIKVRVGGVERECSRLTRA